ncbi:NifB/NifX family molybdenum-iron cluster-binding protein [Sporomusa aerivorans]|uniref:NifB/NifX family molybdenum-iron cluster-binding protein n=1 Tax=Sporomusa aerivorans TaxID=204936 RepID=UPI00352AB357
MPKVAVASTDGITINEHFGRTKEFWIYEAAESGAYTFLERRETPPAVRTLSVHATGNAVELLYDVEAVLVARIGRQAELELRARGIYALQVTGLIDKALAAYGKRGKLIRHHSAGRVAANCQPAVQSGSCRRSCDCKE